MFDERDLEEAGRRLAIVGPPNSEEAIDAIFLSPDPNDRILPFRPIRGHHTNMLGIYAEVSEMREFYEQHIPFAFGHGGEDICLNLRSGSVWYLDSTEYRKGAVEISALFREFLLRYWINAEQGAVDC